MLKAGRWALAALSLWVGGSDAEQTAPDWVERATLPPAILRELPPYCTGVYIDPLRNLQPAPDAPRNLVLWTGYANWVMDEWIELNEGVEVWLSPWRLRADRGRYLQEDSRLELTGGIELREPGMVLRAETASVDQRTRSAHLTDGDFLFHASRLRGRAAALHRDSNGNIEVEQAEFTRCDPGQESWALTSESLHIDPDSGFASAWHARLRLGDLSVLYWPYLYFPIDDRRHTGFLIPTFTQDDRRGTSLTLPIYFNLAPNRDLTLTPQWMSQRGTLVSAEYRYLEHQHSGNLRAEVLPDDRAGATDAPQRSERWALALDHRQQLSSRWSFEAHARRVSDTSYLEDLGSGGLASGSQNHLRQVALLAHQGEYFDFAAEAEGFQRLDPNLTAPYQKLPELRLHWYPQAFGNWHLISRQEYADFDRASDGLTGLDALTGSRMLFDVSLAHEWRSQAGFVVPQWDFHLRDYNLTDHSTGEHRDPTLSAHSFSLDTGVVLERGFAWGGIRQLQTLEPRALLVLNAAPDQDDLPLFDTGRRGLSFNTLFSRNLFSGNDRVSDDRRVTLGLTSRLLSIEGEEWLRLAVAQSYFFDDRAVTLSGPPSAAETDPRTPLIGELEWRLGAYSRLHTTLQTNPSLSRISEGRIHLNWAENPHRFLNLGYRYRRDPVGANTSQMEVSGLLPVNASWHLLGLYHYDLGDNRALEALAGVEWQNCCLQVRVVGQWWREDANAADPFALDAAVHLQVVFKGLFGTGNSLDQLLQSSIPGFYRREESRDDYLLH